MKQYGVFDDVHREYVITDPKTPVKWINYIGGLAFGGFVDQTGGALICKGDPAFNRITRYLAQMPNADFKGETLYLRIHKENGYQVFSPFFVPTLDPYDRYECHVGLGFTRIVSEFYGIRSEVTIFVPDGDGVEIRDIRITNLSQTALQIDVVPVVEYSHPDALKQLTNADWVPQTMVSRKVDLGEGRIGLLHYPFMNRDIQVNLFTANCPVASFETDRKLFLGDNEYQGWARPVSLQTTNLGNNETLRGDNIAALLCPLGTLQPGEERRVITQLRQGISLEAMLPAVLRYFQPPEVDQEFSRLVKFWDSYLEKMQVKSPDPDFDRMINIHNPRQCFITFNWSRYLSLYQLGYGARGIGFRDSSQDVLSVLSNAPQEAKQLIGKLLQVQRRNGSAMHQFNPLTLVASEGDSVEREDLPHYYCDDHLWIVLAVVAYLKETGDIAFLDEMIPFYEKDKAGNPLEIDTVLEHLDRAMHFTWQDIGKHGLPLLGFADWNDTVNLRLGAESLFSANLFGRALREMTDLMRAQEDFDCLQHYETLYAEMKERVNRAAWDGEWYVGYFDCDGTPLGSRDNRYGKIQANAQSWPVLSGFATPERAQMALDAVEKYLNTDFGIKLSMPGFNGFDRAYGGVTTYPPGAKENGGIFLHANPWVIIAETMVGHGERAYKYYRQINPASRNQMIDRYECEPYVYPQNILGNEHPQFGLARNSWLSGTASWMYQAGTQYILGIRPAFQGLTIDPCIPPAWDGFQVARVFRGSTYQITVKNPQHVSKGVVRLVVDGKDQPGNQAPLFTDGQTHRVEVFLGEPRLNTNF